MKNLLILLALSTVMINTAVASPSQAVPARTDYRKSENYVNSVTKFCVEIRDENIKINKIYRECIKEHRTGSIRHHCRVHSSDKKFVWDMTNSYMALAFIECGRFHNDIIRNQAQETQ